MHEYADKHCGHLGSDALMGNPDWARVRELTMADGKPGLGQIRRFLSGVFGGNSNKVMTEMYKMNKAAKAAVISVLPSGLNRAMTKTLQPETSEEQVIGEMVVEMRTRFYQAVKAVYAEGFENGYMDANALTDLRNAADVGCDTAPSSPISDWDEIEKSIQRSFARQKFLRKVCENAFVRGLGPLRTQLLSVLQESVMGSALRVTCYLYAHQEAHLEVTSMVDDGDEKNLSTEEQAAEMVVSESERCCIRAEDHAESMKNEFPDVFRTVKTFQVARTVLMHKQRAIAHLKHRGLLEDKEVKRLENMTEDCVKKLSEQSGKLVTYDGVNAALRDMVPFFGVLSVSRFNRLVAPKITVKKYVIGEGIEPNTFGVVKRGIVEAFDSKYTRSGALSRNGIGKTLGLMNHLVFKEARVSFIAAAAEVEVYQFPASVLDDVMAESVEAWTRVWQVVAFNCARVMSHEIFGSWTHPTKLAVGSEPSPNLFKSTI